jgi:glucose-6-phosphate isomerase
MPTLPYTHDIAECLTAAIGDAGLDAGDLAALVAGTGPGLDLLRRQREHDALPLLALPGRRDDLEELQTVAADWRRRFRRIVVFGTGGSSLGARALAALAPVPDIDVVVPDNLDPDLMARTLAPEKLADTGFLVVSKSGGTGETMLQALTAIAAVEAELGADAISGHFLAIAEPGDSPLRRMAAKFGWPVLAHDPDVGGRYSVLSLTGLLPALMLGLDAVKVREGAAAVLDQALAASDTSEVPAAVGAALNIGFARHRNIHQAVLMGYADALQPFGLWYRQLWAESLGKDGEGTTPIDALGPVDQHSQLQLWLAGPNDKLFTILTTKASGRGPRADAGLAREVGLDYLAGRSVGDLLSAMQRGTADALVARCRPVRRMAIDRLDETTLGALFMHFFLETIIAAGLLKVDPFDQPAVEEGKIRARQYLSEGRA